MILLFLKENHFWLEVQYERSLSIDLSISSVSLSYVTDKTTKWWVHRVTFTRKKKLLAPSTFQ